MLRFTSTLLLLACCTALLCRPGFAENRIGAFTLSPMAGYQVIDGGLELDDGAVFGVGAGYNIDPNWAVEADVRYMPTETDTVDPHDIDIWSLGLGLFYHFQPGKVLNPYLGLGGGGIIYDIDGTTHNDEDYMGFWGGGLKYAVSDSAALRFDLRHILDYRSAGDLDLEDDSHWRHHLQAMAGLSYQFGGQSNYPVRQPRRVVAEVERQAAPVPAPAPEPVPMDSDHDGVFDNSDKCPETAPGVRVDFFGCPADTDGDGVADYLDACLDTPAGSVVDAKGCPVVPIATMAINLRFGPDKAAITPFHYRELDKAAAFIARYPEARVRVVGYTDDRGSDAYNLVLSQERAENVRAALVERYDVSADRITATGKGEAEPVASNETGEGRSENRRVEIEILP